MAIEIVDFPINSMVDLSIVFCQRLPEGYPFLASAAQEDLKYPSRPILWASSPYPYLVGGFNHLEKYEFVSWDHSSQYMESHKIPWFQSPPTSYG